MPSSRHRNVKRYLDGYLERYGISTAAPTYLHKHHSPIFDSHEDIDEKGQQIIIRRIYLLRLFIFYSSLNQ